jgi:outer membrane protein assembly factor BamB
MDTTVRRVAALVGVVGDGRLAALAADAAGCGVATCSPLWTAATGSRITGAPAVSNGTLYLGTADGRLLAYRPVA